MITLALAGGSGIFGAFLVVFFFAVVFALFTRTGSGIEERSYYNQYGGAPGAIGAGTVSGHDELVSVRNWTRGAR
jgi:hypothetical protein